MKSYNINKELKKKYIREFFGYMKNYSKGMSNNIHRSNWGKSPDFNNRRENILDTSPDKEQFYKHKLLTQKKGFKNYYSNENELNDMHLRGRKEYNIKYLKIEHKVNDIFISACYDNPQRDQYLKIINEKRRQNPDKIIEFIIPQFPMFPPLNPYQNMMNPYNQYGQYNPYMNMNMYMMPPPPQYFMQNPTANASKSESGNSNNSNQKSNNKNNNNNNKMETPENPNYNIIQGSNNNNQINVKINNTPNPNALLINNNDSKSNKSTRNSNSGNNIEENIHSSNTNTNSNNLNNINQSDD